MTDRELLELIARHVSNLNTRVDDLTIEMAGVKATMATKQDLAAINMATKQEFDAIKATMATKQELADINMATKQELDTIKATMATKQDLADITATMATKQELADIKAIVVRIENDHGQKLGALFDGYNLISEKLDRVEKKVSKHEEIILKMFK